MFVDRAEITIKAGDGGDGCCSFRREAFVPKGGPNGGDGAPGGDIIFIGDPGEQSLLNFIYNRRFQAQDGGDGKENIQFSASRFLPVHKQTLFRGIIEGIRRRKSFSALRRDVKCA